MKQPSESNIKFESQPRENVKTFDYSDKGHLSIDKSSSNQITTSNAKKPSKFTSNTNSMFLTPEA